MNSTKFMQTLEDEIFNQLVKEAREKGITVQQHIRGTIIPEWIAWAKAFGKIKA